MTGADHEERLTRSWRTNAETWTHAVRANALESRRLVTDEAITRAVLDGTTGSVLDAGCGEGWLARRLAAAGRTVLGIDGSAELVRAAIAAGGAHYRVLSYEQLVQEPGLAGSGWDVVVCNFSLLGDPLRPVLSALRQATAHGGSVIIQTLHPLVAGADGAYRNGWREETFEGMAGEWEPMPWFFRTFGSWLDELHAAGWQLVRCMEPLHPLTGQPASLILHAANRDPGGSPDSVTLTPGLP